MPPAVRSLASRIRAQIFSSVLWMLRIVHAARYEQFMYRNEAFPGLTTELNTALAQKQQLWNDLEAAQRECEVLRGQARAWEQADGTVRELETLYRAHYLPDLPEHLGRAALLHKLIGTTVGEALYILRHLYLALRVPGDVCEFGVAQGATSRLLAFELLDTERGLWLFDSFEGLPAPSAKDVLIDDIFGLGSMAAYQGTMCHAEDEVRAKLAEVGFPPPRTNIRKGWVDATLAAGDVPAQVCFAYVDFDFYEPIRDALDYLDKVMPVGGHIVVDDYGFFSAGAQAAVDEFVAARPGRYQLSMPVSAAGHFAILEKIG